MQLQYSTPHLQPYITDAKIFIALSSHPSSKHCFHQTSISTRGLSNLTSPTRSFSIRVFTNQATANTNDLIRHKSLTVCVQSHKPRFYECQEWWWLRKPTAWIGLTAGRSALCTVVSLEAARSNKMSGITYVMRLSASMWGDRRNGCVVSCCIFVLPTAYQGLFCMLIWRCEDI